jgi:hypothetical protein
VGNSRQRLAQIRGREIRRLAEQFVASIRELDWQLNLLEHSVERVEEMIEQQFEELATVAKRQGAKNLPIHSRLRGESRPQPERVR